MKNLNINFSNPWLLFILIAFLVFTLIPHLRIKKKYRRNRNRIISLVLHLVVSFLLTLTLAGMTFNYDVTNDENEIILLVDSSESDTRQAEKRDEYVETILDNGTGEGFKIGVVKFGFDQVYAVPLTTKVSSIYDAYLSSEDPDTSATDIAAALTYTKGLFNYPETSKIILITDAKETDEDANSVIKSVSAAGIKVDVCYINTDYTEEDTQIISLKLPETHMNINEEYTFTFTVESNVATTIDAKLSDNGTEKNKATYDVKPGTNELTIKHTFETTGSHELSVEISSTNDTLTNNNAYYTYVDIQKFNKVLVLESITGESNTLAQLLTEGEYDVTTYNIQDPEAPQTTTALRAYDQVILNNISNEDMPEGFAEQLESYTEVYGGSVLTVGGNKSSGDANTYVRSDMYGTTYQDMLPVQAINYTPPVGVMIIIDKSGSMSSTDAETGFSKLEMAEKGALSCLDSLSERDYVGIMTLDSDYNMILPMTPRSQEAKIRAAIDSIGTTASGGTVFNSSLSRAVDQLNALDVARKHIILITDGMPGDSGQKDEQGNILYEKTIADAYTNNGITTSIVLLGYSDESSVANTMQSATDKGHGYLYAMTDTSKLVAKLREDLSVPEIKELNQEDFYPIVNDLFSTVVNGVEISTNKETANQLSFQLSGFYGTKAKSQADVILVGDYNVPIYAQWKYGKGMVGSLMVDLVGAYSNEMLNSNDGVTIIKNIVSTIMPTEDIKATEIETVIKGDNYINTMSVYSTLEEGQSITGTISYLTNDSVSPVSLNENTSLTIEERKNEYYYVTSALSADSAYSRCTFVIKQAGTYVITLNKVASDGTILSTTTTYKKFSYSKEYDVYQESDDINYQDTATTLAEKGNGEIYLNTDDSAAAFEGFITELHKSFDPRYIFLITSLVLFLLDIAVRKFKFKWIHELVREHKENKVKEVNQQNKN